MVCGLVVWRLGISFDSFIFLPHYAPLSYAYLDFNNTISLQTQEPEIKTSNGQWASVGHFLFKNKLQYLVRISYIVSLLIGVFLKNHNNIIHIYCCCKYKKGLFRTPPRREIIDPDLANQFTHFPSEPLHPSARHWPSSSPGVGESWFKTDQTFLSFLFPILFFFSWRVGFSRGSLSPLSEVTLPESQRRSSGGTMRCSKCTAM